MFMIMGFLVVTTLPFDVHSADAGYDHFMARKNRRMGNFMALSLTVLSFTSTIQRPHIGGFGAIPMLVVLFCPHRVHVLRAPRATTLFSCFLVLNRVDVMATQIHGAYYAEEAWNRHMFMWLAILNICVVVAMSASLAYYRSQGVGPSLVALHTARNLFAGIVS